MMRLGARPGIVLAWFGTAGLLAAAAPAAAAAIGEAFDSDDVSISGSRADFEGDLAWSDSTTGPETVGKLTGRLAADRKCARLQVDWLDAGTGTLDSDKRSTCDGSDRISVRFKHASLECARVRLFYAGDETGPTRLVCAGGS
jgi:hypothetical protein